MFSPEWEVDVAACVDHAHILIVLPLKPDIGFEDLDTYAGGVFDDIEKVVTEIIGEAVEGEAKITGSEFEDEDGVLLFVIELRAHTEFKSP